MPTELAWQWGDLLKLVIALVLGLAIGMERELRHKPAGLKTISLVTLAGAALALLSIYLGHLTGAGSEVDLARLLAGVLTGIGFIGAGTIIRSGVHVEGITTAAVIWSMSAVGMAIGVGAWQLALATYLLIWAVLLLDPLLSRLVTKLRRSEGDVLLPPDDS